MKILAYNGFLKARFLYAGFYYIQFSEAQVCQLLFEFAHSTTLKASVGHVTVA